MQSTAKRGPPVLAVLNLCSSHRCNVPLVPVTSLIQRLDKSAPALGRKGRMCGSLALSPA